MAKLLSRRKLITAKIESTYNTDPAPSASSDAVLVEELAWSNEGLKMIERPAVRPSLGALQHIYGGRLVTVTFSVEVKGSGAAGTAPEIGALLRACGLAETVSGGVSVTYDPASTGHESVTCWVYEDGKLIKVTGCRGNVAFTLEAGNKVTAAFTLSGHVTAQTDTALATPTFDSTTPEPFIGGAFTIDSFSAVISSLSFDLSNQLAMPESVNAGDGYDEITIVSRDVNGSFNPLDELVASEDYIGQFTAGAAMALTTGAIGATAGNILTITMPAVYYRDASPADRDGLAGLELTYGAAESTTDDEFSMVFT
jgi:hypothetical protein